MTKPSFPENSPFSYDVLTTYSIKKLKRMQEDEKKSSGTFVWYMYPCNIKKLLEYIIWEKTENIQ